MPTPGVEQPAGVQALERLLELFLIVIKVEIIVETGPLRTMADLTDGHCIDQCIVLPTSPPVGRAQWICDENVQRNAILYELLVGRAPFRGANDLETLRLASADPHD